MKNHSKTTQPVPTLFEKPAKARILEAADEVFRIHGVHVGIGVIAHRAETNTETVIKYFRYQERLVSIFLKSLIKDAEQCWADVISGCPNEPVRILSWWTLHEEGGRDDPFRYEVLLARSAAELARVYPKNPLLVEIEQYWQAERRRIVKFCEAANLREPRDLADKLLLLVHGARNERGAFGQHAPSRLLHQTADDLLVSHGADRELLYVLPDD